MESAEGGAYMVVVADELDEAEARRIMEQPVDVGDGVVLHPDGPVQAVATSHLTGSYTVAGAAGEYLGTVDMRLTSSRARRGVRAPLPASRARSSSSTARASPSCPR